MENSKGFNNWIPLLTKLVWPVIIIIALIIFNKQVSEVYILVMKSIKEGRNVEIGGFLKLGEAASTTEIGTITRDEIPIESLGGGTGVVRKGSGNHLQNIQQELEENPNKIINTLTLPDNIGYSTDMIKQYISTLGLKYAVFLKNNKFDGWMMASNLAAQLPDNDERKSYNGLKNDLAGIKNSKSDPTDSAKEVLAKMQELHIESLPVVGDDGQWLFFANREEILASLMTTLLLEE